MKDFPLKSNNGNKMCKIRYILPPVMAQEDQVSWPGVGKTQEVMSE